MQWVEPSGSPEESVLRSADSGDDLPERIQSELFRIREAMRQGRHAEAVDGFEAMIARGEGAYVNWSALSSSYLALRRAAEALQACQRGEELGVDEPRLFMCKARALAALGQHAASIEVFDREFQRTGDIHSLFGALRLLVRAGDGAEVLRYCSLASDTHGDNTVLRAIRAIAYSMTGDRDAACALVDLDRHVAVASIEGRQSGDLVDFNARLATEGRLLLDPSPDFTLINEVHLPPPECSALVELRSIVKTAVDSYVQEASKRGLGHWLPSQLPPVRLRSGVTMVRAGGTAGQHIHRTSLFSIVYHVDVPEAVLVAKDGRGDLQIGAVEKFSGGHKACWGERRVPAQPGQLTIFPAHFFHDVIPTGVDPVRTSMVFDVIPA
ncbi:putative 2OG-Fe(II) oxygenase [Parerythrobacter aestuarii]|uniref:putative 2OG-Fe(II) oxygenase n=1 Tax=Parerythrobacter aestuarii TaxID=3020909 RepID=UPI0024DE3684|nr:putative 2OG-Fe(II) oxygenase [Parerythrobacter aestuarii]